MDIAQFGIVITIETRKAKRQQRRIARVEREARTLDAHRDTLDALTKAVRDQIRRDGGKLILKPYQ